MNYTISYILYTASSVSFYFRNYSDDRQVNWLIFTEELKLRVIFLMASQLNLFKILSILKIHLLYVFHIKVLWVYRTFLFEFEFLSLGLHERLKRIKVSAVYFMTIVSQLLIGFLLYSCKQQSSETGSIPHVLLCLVYVNFKGI